ncbi:DUF4214 domain-containing protein [Devosia naphthalenivorans]|uniref:DUF4214 domain-containing protein n=1 Tax=Devosia naphthalenivorans TaxID=2082392 RepID=UPI000D343EDA|nr:DUF4214 domain-containing protein [Devosia naphthalenivorans]
MTPVEQITSLYIGYFGRAPDPEGLNYWVGRLAEGYTLAEAAESFSVQSESTTKYPYLANPNIASPQAFITQVYMNLFNRVPDAEGLAYWTAELENGADVGDFILNVISGAVTEPDATIVANKVEVGADFALSAANEEGFVYDDAAASAAIGVIDGVDETEASVEAGKAETDAFIDGIDEDEGLTITLSDNIDAPGTSGPGVDTEGSELDDTFIGDSTTFNPGDVIDGNGGVDTLELFLTGGATVRSTDVENIEVNAVGGAVGVLMTNAVGVETVSSINSFGDVSFVDLQNNVDVSVVDSDADVGVSFDGDVLGGDEANINLSVDGFGDNGSYSTFTVDTDGDTVTSLAVTAEGDNFFIVEEVDAEELDLETLTISGAGEVNIYENATEFEDLTTVAAAAASGGVNIDLSDNDEDLTATFGAGDDQIVLGAGEFNGDDTLDGGAGDADSLAIDADDVDEAAGGVTGFEVLQVYGAGGAALEISGDDFLSVALRGNVGQAIELENFTDGTVYLAVNGTQAGPITFDDTDNVSFVVGDAEEISSVSAEYWGDYEVDETVTDLNLTGVTSASFSVADEDDSLIVSTLTLDDTETLTFSGEGDVTLTAVVDAGNELATLDLSGFEGTFITTGELSDGGIDILVGNLDDTSSIVLDAAGAASDVLTFGETLDGDISVDNFEFGVGGDTLDLGALGFASFADVNAATTEVGGNAVIDTGDGSITLVGVALGDLDAANFAF